MDVSRHTWTRIRGLLPRNGRRGRPWRDHRQVIAAICWKLETGKPWRHLPAHFGPWQTAYDRYNRWRKDGTWQRIEELLRQETLGGAKRPQTLIHSGSCGRRGAELRESRVLERSA